MNSAPHLKRRAADSALMTLNDLTLVLVYACVLVIKECPYSEELCATFGFGQKAEGEANRALCTPSRAGGARCVKCPRSFAHHPVQASSSSSSSPLW